MHESTETQKKGLLAWIDERLGIEGLRYPIPRHANRLVHSLGGITLGTFVLLVISGLVLTQFYQPGDASAHQSVLRLTDDVTAGRFLRGFHYWSSMSMVVLVALHVARVFITGAFKRPREASWLIGVVLAALTGLFFVSGTILKWDQEAYEAFAHNREIGEMLGFLGFWFGSFGAPLLERFYALHVVILPLVFTAAVAAHLLLIKRFGMAPTPFYRGPEPEPTVPFISHIKELALYALVVAGVVSVLSIAASPTLGPLPDKAIEVTKPPWPVLWLYGAEDLVGVSGILWASLIVLIALVVVPFVDRSSEQHPRRRLWIMITAGLLVGVIIALALYAGLTPAESHMET